jgi:mRNA-degrading endonuclease RelE of RelBE toxin-antitoxin system
MHKSEIKPDLHRLLAKLCKKDKNLYYSILNKMQEIIASEDIEHYKNLRYDLKFYKRVHIGHFVLVFFYDKARDTVTFEDFDHHDKIYQH